MSTIQDKREKRAQEVRKQSRQKIWQEKRLCYFDRRACDQMAVQDMAQYYEELKDSKEFSQKLHLYGILHRLFPMLKASNDEVLQDLTYVLSFIVMDDDAADTFKAMRGHLYMEELMLHANFKIAEQALLVMGNMYNYKLSEICLERLPKVFQYFHTNKQTRELASFTWFILTNNCRADWVPQCVQFCIEIADQNSLTEILRFVNKLDIHIKRAEQLEQSLIRNFSFDNYNLQANILEFALHQQIYHDSLITIALNSNKIIVIKALLKLIIDQIVRKRLNNFSSKIESILTRFIKEEQTSKLVLEYLEVLLSRVNCLELTDEFYVAFIASLTNEHLPVMRLLLLKSPRIGYFIHLQDRQMISRFAYGHEILNQL